MTFLDFAHQHGLIVDHLIADGYWHRCKTVDHPRKRNGTYLLHGDWGFCKNWANMDGVALWRQDGKQWGAVPFQHNSDATKRLRRTQERAREAATALLRDCTRATHPYLARKGFPAVQGLVHAPTGDLIVPMRDCCNYATINSVQKINVAGEKKFLSGGKAKGSVYVFDSKRSQYSTWLVEGWATGFSVVRAMFSCHQPVKVVVCFSAGNLEYVASRIKADYVFADNDESGAGERAAKATGLPYTMWDKIGDANDAHQAEGIRKVASLMLDTMNRADER